MSIRRVGLTALVAAAGLLISANTVLAVEAAAKSAVNVRTGPGTSYAKVDQLTAGEVVEITECAPVGWCFIQHEGPDGWVSGSYLVPVEDEAIDEDDFDEGGGSNPDCSFGFTIGSGGPSLSINCGDGPLPPPPAPPAPPEPPAGAEACFYTGADFSGSQFCMGPGIRNSLNGTFNDKITSVELFGGAKARLCTNTNLTGTCKTITSDTDQLANSINNKASSLTVFTGPAPVDPPILIDPPILVPVVPSTHSTGPIDLQQTWDMNLDNGASGDAGGDVWYRAVTATEKYLQPINGARMALGDGSNRGFTGCNAESFSTAKIALDDAPVGTYICAKTNEGRISQFRVNGFVGTTMKIGYTTWSN